MGLLPNLEAKLKSAAFALVKSSFLKLIRGCQLNAESNNRPRYENTLVLGRAQDPKMNFVDLLERGPATITKDFFLLTDRSNSSRKFVKVQQGLQVLSGFSLLNCLISV